MKRIMRLFLAALLIGLCALRSADAQTAQPKPKDPEIPGSATMPPRVKVESAPAKPGKPGVVKLGLWIKQDGMVENAEFIDGNKEWKDACIEAAKKVQFEPVVWEGKGIPARVELEYKFDGRHVLSMFMPLPNFPGEAHAVEEWGLTKASLERDPDLVLPLMQRAHPMTPIEAGISYVISEDGTTDKIKLLGANSEGAVRATYDLVAERKYVPAKVRGQPVRTEFKQVFAFQNMGKPIEALAGANHLVDPVFPYERLLSGDEGHAIVKFTLSGEGNVESSVVLEASHPEFGSALVAAIDHWSFKPESIATAGAIREYRHDFLLEQTPYAARRLIASARAGEEVSNSRAGLDAKPKALAGPGLVYPSALLAEKVSGAATVEFIIDRVGLAQLPRVLKATKPEFGWAAVTVVNGMRFTPLTRGGKTAELRVVMPINFTPPKPAEAQAAAPATGAGG